MKRRDFAVCVATTALIPKLSQAVDYPVRPIKLVVPYGPGTATDYLARQVSAEAQKALGQAIVIENRAGAGGITGTEAVIRSAPDAYTLLVGTTQTHAINPALYAKLPYRPLEDLSPVVGLAIQPHVLVVAPQLQVNTVADLVAVAKSQRVRVTFASTGNGTPAHLVGEIFRREAGIEATHVPYPGGAQALTDVMTGTVSMLFYPYQPVKPHIDAGKLKVLATAHATRPDWLPQVRTMPEQGFPKSVIAAWFGIYAPARTPEDRIQLLGNAFLGALGAPAITLTLPPTGTTIQAQTAAELGRFTATELERYKSLVAMSGAKVE